MSSVIYWRLPTHGDGRAVHPGGWNRGDFVAARSNAGVFARTSGQRDGYTYFDQLAQIARAAELSGFDGLWVPHSPVGEESQIVASSLAREARRVRWTTSLFPPQLSAVYSAKIGVSFQRLSGGRLDWNLVFEQPGPRAWHGRTFPLSQQIERAGEFLTVARGFWTSQNYDFHGNHYEVEGGGFPEALQGQPFPKVHISGDLDEALELSARHADVHVLAPRPLEELKQRIQLLDGLAAQHGRRLEYALEADIVVRHDSASAWAELRRQWDVARAKTVPLHPSAPTVSGKNFDEAVAGPNLWSGFDVLRAGSSYGLVGGYADVADQLASYLDIGVSRLILSAPPHLEEAYRFGEFVLPRLRAHRPAQAAA